MKKLISVLMIFTIVISLGARIINENWTLKYKSELNDFFGEGNWEVISEETKESIMYSEYIRYYNNPVFSKTAPGKYKDWNILFKNKEGEDEIWKISNHTFKINNDRNRGLFSKKLSGKQALTLELMDISLGMISDKIYNDVVKSILSENESDCIDLILTYEGGNPKPDYYSKLAKQSWFNVDSVTAENYLSDTTVNFYILIRVSDYGFKKLTEEERENITNSVKVIKDKLLDKYGDIASFEIYLDKDNNVKYKNGIEINR